MTLVKICGICSPGDAVAAESAGADLLGFHFCASLRRVEPEDARRMIRGLAGSARTVGVFMDEDPDVVNQIAADLGLDLVQLHGSEAPGYPAEVPVLKTLKMRPGGELPDASAWPDPILLDSWSPDGRGGTGRVWDWAAAAPLMATRRTLIGGGLTPLSVGELVSRWRPYGVDVSSGVESAPRVKDRDAVLAFVRAARGADGAA